MIPADSKTVSSKILQNSLPTYDVKKPLSEISEEVIVTETVQDVKLGADVDELLKPDE